MLVGKEKRLNRIVGDGCGPIIVSPIDDSLLAGPFAGLEDMGKLIARICIGQPSAILGFRGTLERYSAVIGQVPTILNCTASVVGPRHTDKVQVHEVAEAHQIGADAVAAHFNLTSTSELTSIAAFSKIASEAREIGLPVLAIAYPRKTIDGSDENYLELRENDKTAYARLVAHCVRVAVELGADLIKTHYTGSDSSFAMVLDGSQGVPIVVSGGPKVSERKAISHACQAVRSGASGISFGRNIFGRSDPGVFLKTLRQELERD